MDILDKKYKLKKFLRVIFKGIEEDEYIRVYQNKDEYSKVTFFNDIDNLIDSVINKYNYSNTYFQLATTSGNSGKEEDLLYRYCLGFDFDKKDYTDGFNHQDILNKFKELGLWYHALVDSGNGYHAYVVIERTSDIEKVNAVQNTLCKLLGADENAIKKTQILRVPFTYNVKGKSKLVKIINLFEKATIKPYSINKLYNRLCGSFKETTASDKNIAYTLKRNMPICIKNALESGSKVGNRNKDLYNIVVYLKHKGNNIKHIRAIVNEWNSKNKEILKETELDYQVEYIFANCNGFRCSECNSSIKLECKDYTTSDFNLKQYRENILSIQTKVGRQLKDSKRKGVKTMSGNELFIYNVLLNNKDLILNIDEITKLITDRKTKKAALTEKYVREALKGLEEKGYISIIKGNRRLKELDTYCVNAKKVKENNIIKVTYFINLAVIWGRISTAELKCYTRMRYLHHQEILKGKAKGNIFTISMEELAKDLGITQPRVSEMIKNLYENNILDRRALPLENNPKQFYYQYKLNM